jgi:hypothetical protein
MSKYYYVEHIDYLPIETSGQMEIRPSCKLDDRTLTRRRFTNYRKATSYAKSLKRSAQTNKWLAKVELHIIIDRCEVFYPQEKL